MISEITHLDLICMIIESGLQICHCYQKYEVIPKGINRVYLNRCYNKMRGIVFSHHNMIVVEINFSKVRTFDRNKWNQINLE
jgi:hypothetical protein